MKVICISLQRRKDRAERVKEHLTNIGLYDDLIMMPAFDGAKMPKFSYTPPKRQYFSFKDEFGNPSDMFNKYQIACSLSHIQALHMAKALSLHEVLIVEDDVEFNNKPILEDITKSVPEDWELIFLGYAERRWANMPRNEISQYVISPGFVDGAHAYIINSKGYDKVIDAALSFKTTYDDAINDARFSSNNPLIAYAVRPKIAFQYESFSEIDRKVIDRKDLK